MNLDHASMGSRAPVPDTASEATSSTRNTKRKRERSRPRPERPKFLDATAVVSVAKFSARRMPEIENLWSNHVTNWKPTHEKGKGNNSQLTEKSSNHENCHHDICDKDDHRRACEFGDLVAPYRSQGGKASRRHMRRRANSHLPRRRHRFPRTSSFQSLEDKAWKAPQAVDRVLTKHNEEQSFSWESGKHRRRQTQESSSCRCRRARRNPRGLAAMHRKWAEGEGDNEGSSCVGSTTSVVNWIDTHLWHAKRFRMAPNLFNWAIPLIHTNRGSRAALRLVCSSGTEGGTGCTIQDATWLHRPIVWTVTRAKWNELLGALRRCVFGPSMGDGAVLAGVRIGETAWIHDVDRFPLGCIGPARILFEWFIIPNIKTDSTERKNEDGDNYEKGDVLNVRVSIMVHPSIEKQVESIISSLLRSINESTAAVFRGHSRMAVIRVRGVNATRVVAKAIHSGVISSSTILNNSSMRFPFDKRFTLEWEELRTCSPAHHALPHGSIVPICIDETEGMMVMEEHDLSRSLRESIKETNKKVSNFYPDAESFPQNMYSSSPEHFIHRHDACCCVLLVSQSPNSVDTPNLKRLNAGVSGWDILCHIDVAKSIFLEMQHCNASAIGLVEDGALRLEAEPPLPVFPRDYPDTEQGRLYWSGGDSSSSDDCDFFRDWMVVRTALEVGGWGRCGTQVTRCLEHHRTWRAREEDHGKRENESTRKQNELMEEVFGSWNINWTALVKDKEVAAGEGGVNNLAVVRGEFVFPFARALTGHVRSCQQDQPGLSEGLDEKQDHSSLKMQRKRRRRPRRRVRSSREGVILPPNELPSKDETAEHSMACQTLLESLSLPALLRCSVLMKARGTITIGATILDFSSGASLGCKKGADSDSNPSVSSALLDDDDVGVLGRVVAGSFSPGRGLCHGVGIIGAARFLRAVAKVSIASSTSASEAGPSRLIVTNHSPDMRRVELLVHVRNPSPESLNREGALMVLL